MRKIFVDAPRPEHFTNYLHCEECREHDDLLRSKDVGSLSFKDIGNSGWSPVPFMTEEAMRYYFPPLVRVALDPELKGSPVNFLSILFFNLGHDNLKKFVLFNNEERKAVLALLNHLKGSLSERFGYDEDDSKELAPLIEKWTKFSEEN